MTHPDHNGFIALSRLIPLLFPIIFISAAVSGMLDVLYVAIGLHILIMAAEITIGRQYAVRAVPVLHSGSTAFEDSCLYVWAGVHLAVFGATLYFVASTDLSGRQIFAVGALFAYSINAFSAATAHELLHRHSPALRLAACLLYITMLYPHFPAIHLISHHRTTDNDIDCQSPRQRQSIHSYLIQALFGGIKLVRTCIRSLDYKIELCLLFSAALLMLPLALGMPRLSLFIAAQGLFSFLIIEAINFIQHYHACRDDGDVPLQTGNHINQDVNFVSRCFLLNLPLHAAHHRHPDFPYPALVPIEGMSTYRLGYWCSFWLIWIPPLWDNLQRKLRENHN